MTSLLAAPAKHGVLTQPRPQYAPPKPAPVERSVALDAYRGFVMLAIVCGGLQLAALPKHPAYDWLTDQLEHRLWQGCTAWDLIQPSFMFLVGASMPFAFARRRERGEPWGRQLLHVLRRCLLLAAIGVFLDLYHEQKLQVQLLRVLQQIALAYPLAFLVLHRGPRWQAAAAGLFLALHTAAFLGYGWANGVDPWSRYDNVGVWLDRALHLPLSKGHYVTLNALSSSATILFGVLAGELLRSDWPARHKAVTLGVAGVVGILLGEAMSPWVPEVKRIWTASFALLSGGWTCLMLLGFYWVIDVRGRKAWAFPLVVFGMNSIAAYFMASWLSPDVRKAIAPFVGTLKGPPEWVAAVGSPAWLVQLFVAGPVVIAVLTTLVIWLICLWLYRRKIFFKV